MPETERIRQRLWRILDDLEDGELDEGETETRVGVLDSLIELLRIEQEAIQKEKEGDAQEHAAKPARRFWR